MPGAADIPIVRLNPGALNCFDGLEWLSSQLTKVTGMDREEDGGSSFEWHIVFLEGLGCVLEALVKLKHGKKSRGSKSDKTRPNSAQDAGRLACSRPVAGMSQCSQCSTR